MADPKDSVSPIPISGAPAVPNAQPSSIQTAAEAPSSTSSPVASKSGSPDPDSVIPNSSPPPPAGGKPLKPPTATSSTWASRLNPSREVSYAEPTYLDDGTPKVIIPSAVIRKTSESWKEFLLGRFCGAAPPISRILTDLSPIWGKFGKLSVHKAGPNAFLFHISNASTRQWVLDVGLWQVSKCSLVVTRYSPSNSIQNFDLVSAPIWVTLSNIPPEMFSEEAVLHIARGVGKPVTPQKPVLDYSNIGEAKLRVEIYLADNLPPEVMASDEQGNGVRIKASYPNLPFKCSICHFFGHASSRCPRAQQPSKKGKAGRSEARPTADPATNPAPVPAPTTVPALSDPAPSTPSPPSAPSTPAPLSPLGTTLPSVTQPKLPNTGPVSQPSTVNGPPLISVGPVQQTTSAQSLLASFIGPYSLAGSTDLPSLPKTLTPSPPSIPDSSTPAATNTSCPQAELCETLPPPALTPSQHPPPNLLHLIPFSPPPLQAVAPNAKQHPPEDSDSLTGDMATAKKLMKRREALSKTAGPTIQTSHSHVSPSVDGTATTDSGRGGH